MFKLVALWSAPKLEDRAAFEAAYLDTHVPLACALPNLCGVEPILMEEGLEGAGSDRGMSQNLIASTRA